MILSGGGDFTIVLKLLRHKFSGQEVVFIDHPYKAGVTAFEK